MKFAIGVLLSGNSTVYHYAASEIELFTCSVGDKVVIPNKLKDDGTLSMSIGTYIGRSSDVAAEGLKPIVQFLGHDAVCSAREAVAKMTEVKA